ncbi:MAG: DnaA/Hda family protein [Clostridia bacterium]
MIPNEILIEYAASKRKAEDEAKLRLEFLMRKQPRILDLENKRHELAISGFFHTENFEDFKKEYEAKLSAIDEVENAILLDLGLPYDYFKPRYRCQKCKDTGYIGEPLKNRCSCLVQRLLSYRFSKSSVEKNETFENFDENIYKDSEQKRRALSIKRFCEEYSEAIPNSDVKNILFSGETGLGKTFFLNCITQRLISRDIYTLKATAYTFINDALNAIRNNSTPDEYINADILLLDDLGSEPMIPNITLEFMFSVINERMIHGKNTVIATNLSMKTILNKYGERIFSRICDSRSTRLITLVGDDLRINIHKQ